jgi:hypothetical protein
LDTALLRLLREVIPDTALDQSQSVCLRILTIHL